MGVTVAGVGGLGAVVGVAFGVDVVFGLLSAAGFVCAASGGAGNWGFGRVNDPFWPQPTKMIVSAHVAAIGAKAALNGF